MIGRTKHENPLSKVDDPRKVGRLLIICLKRDISFLRGVQTDSWARQASCLKAIGHEEAQMCREPSSLPRGVALKRGTICLFFRLTAIYTSIAVLWNMAPAIRWFLARLIFYPKDGADTN
jgi:hypothetical protein